MKARCRTGGRLTPDQVPEAAGQEQEAAEGDEVGVHDPGQVGLAEVQVALDGGRATFTIVPSSAFMSMAETDDGQGDPPAPGRDPRCLT